MKVDVRFRSLEPSEALREHAARRVHFQLSRFGHEVASVLLRVSDVNGPRGGVDKRCQVTVRGRWLSSVIVEDFSADAQSAIDLAVERAARAVGRSLERARASRMPALNLRGAT